MPQLRKAELIEGVVYMPSLDTLRQGLATPEHVAFVDWLKAARRST
jgi:hypothetical protein